MAYLNTPAVALHQRGRRLSPGLQARIERLKPQQRGAFEGLCELIRKAKPPGAVHDPSDALVVGSAGVGKTELATAVIRFAQEQFPCYAKAVQVIAPTHKAASVLRAKIEASGCAPMDVVTVSAALKKRKGRDKHGNKVFVQSSDPKEHPYRSPHLQLVLIDEVSMLSETDLELFVRYFNSVKPKTNPSSYHQLVVIGFGDPEQLPPVENGKLCSWIADATVPEVRYSLTEVVRHQGPVLALANALVQAKDQHRLPNFAQFASTAADEPSSVAYLGRAKWMRTWLEHLTLQRESPLEHDVQMLSFRNETSSRLNAIARAHIFGESAEPFQLGERLISTEAIMDPYTNLVQAGSACEMVIEARTWKNLDLFGEQFRACDIEAFLPHDRDEYGSAKEILFTTLAPDQWEEFGRLLTKTRAHALEQQALKRQAEKAKERWSIVAEDERRARWRKFYGLDELFARVEPAYSFTVHKSQGSTYRTVFVDLPDLTSAPDFDTSRRLAYVACSRASHELFLSR
jgi:exodeoxyribonuclease-5